MAPIFKYGILIFKYRPDIQIFEYISHYFYITLAFQINGRKQIFNTVYEEIL